MTPAQLEKLKKLCAEATPGPWEQSREHFVELCAALEDSPDRADEVYDLSFITAARSVVPELIAEVERLRELVKDAECAGWRGPVVTPGACPWCVGEFRIFGGNGSTVLHAVDCPAFGPEGEVK